MVYDTVDVLAVCMYRACQLTVHEQQLSSVHDTCIQCRRCYIALATLIPGRSQHPVIDQSALRRLSSQ